MRRHLKDTLTNSPSAQRWLDKECSETVPDPKRRTESGRMPCPDKALYTCVWPDRRLGEDMRRFPCHQHAKALLRMAKVIGISHNDLQMEPLETWLSKSWN